MEKLLSELVKRLQEAYGGDLVSVVLYGSAASGNHHDKFSDLNVICILKQVSVEDLQKGGKVIQWWLKQKQPAPLLLSAAEVQEAHDVFPIEFLDIQQSHRILYGEDLFVQIGVDRTNHRRQVEHELRSSLLRLRQHYLRLHPSEKEVVQLMAKSLPSFATLARHALMLAGAGAPTRKPEIFAAAAALFGLDSKPFEIILRIREGKEKVSGDRDRSLFASYLEQITKLTQAIDRL